MPLTHRVIIEVVGGSDFDATRAELRINVIIGNNGNDALRQGQVNGLANQVAIPIIVRVHRYRSITQHGFRSRCGDNQMTLATAKGVAQMPQGAGLFFLDHFKVGYCRQELWVPINQTMASVYQALLV